MNYSNSLQADNKSIVSCCMQKDRHSCEQLREQQAKQIWRGDIRKATKERSIISSRAFG